MDASPRSTSSDEEPQRCTPARSHIMFYVLATIAAVVLYVVGIMPNKATEAPAPDVVQRPLAHAEIEMSDVAALSTHAPQPEEKSPFFKMLPEKVQDWYFEEKRNLKQQMHKTQVTYYKSPHHLVHTNADQFLKSQPELQAQQMRSIAERESVLDFKRLGSEVETQPNSAVRPMAPPKLPAIHGRPGMEKSASMPRIEAPHPLTVPSFRRPDVSGQLQEIGQLSSKIVGPGGISKKMRALTASSSTPDLRGGVKTSELVRQPVPQVAPLQESQSSSPPRNAGGAYPAPVAAAPEPPKEEKLEYMKPAEAAHYNFRNLPLEIFDHAPDFEVKTPQEWMKEVLKDTSRPQACVVHYKNKKWTMVRCWVLRYEESINRYIVELEDASQKKVKRLSLRFNAEDPKNFEKRVETCRARKAHCELQEAFIDYIEYKDDKLVTPMPRSEKEFFIRACLERCSLEEPNGHGSTIRELMQEVEENYILCMKLFNVKVELIPLFGTKEAFLPDESNEFSMQFASVMKSFLPLQCPESGLVEHAQPEMGVKQLVAEMLQMPLLGSSVFAITSQVWRRYINEVARMELVDTTRVGGVDVTRQRKLIKNGDSIIFEPKDMFEHQKNHIERITNHLKRGWRDYIIAEVLDKLSDDYNFFSDDFEKHMQSPLHALLRKLDLIINSQLRWSTACTASLVRWNMTADILRSS
ncbi:unnamed protein product [Cladocopium goreaui]|uniref:Uncharacterized protein n=1 Tax=Cladocopium goreaui TaxID=2562237 RepID=A0A9P1GP47_9DINO|nr:unnamed protein product [Cladocopium goreaui]